MVSNSFIKNQELTDHLLPKDHEEKNLNNTNYRNQINKVALAIKELITGLLTKPSESLKEKDSARKDNRRSNRRRKSIEAFRTFKIIQTKGNLWRIDHGDTNNCCNTYLSEIIPKIRRARC